MLRSSMESILHDLTDEQKQAVAHKDGPLLVLAGAGTGKTRVITHRIAALVKSGVRADRILAITFTNKAAGEMRERIEDLVHGSPTVSTFHSFGARVLRRHAKLVGLDKYFTIFDDSDQLACVKDAAGEAKIDLESWSPKMLVAGISGFKNKCMSPKEVEEIAISPKQRAIAQVYPWYQKFLRERNAVDFDDLILLSLKLLKESKDVQYTWSEWYQYVLVDEYQDTNTVQYQLTMALAAKHRNICVTGDPDQSIYAWRGADISNILNFERDFKDAKVVTLTKNFRSTQKILDAANQLISHNIRRKEKNLEGVQGDGQDVTIRDFESGEEEAFFVARRVSELVREGRKASEIAILYRANFLSRLLEESLVHRGIPYKVVGAVAFYQRKEIKDLISYLRLLVNTDDDYAALRIINTPARRIGASTISKLNAKRREFDISLYAMAGRVNEVEGLGSRAKKAVLAWFAMMEQFRAKMDDGASVETLLLDIVERIEYKKYLKKAYPTDQDRLDNVLAFIDAGAEFDTQCLRQQAHLESQKQQPIEPSQDLLFQEKPPIDQDELRVPGVHGFLEHIALVSAADDLEDKDITNRISLMTVHTAKGLEFETVFVIALEDGLFPNSRALEESWGKEEERRLAYVAFTRAKHHLILTHCHHRTRFGRFGVNEPSPFLHESGLVQEAPRKRSFFDDDISQVPNDWDEDKPRAKPSRWRLAPQTAPKKAKPKYAPSPVLKRGAAIPRAKDVKSPFKVGDRVRHEHFGDGEVSSVRGYGPATRVQVRFDRYGEKTLVMQYARLTKVN